MRILSYVLLVITLIVGASSAHAFATIKIWNNTGKTVLEGGDMVQVLIQHSLDEEFSEIYFGTESKTSYTGGWNDPPFITKMNSSDGQKKDVLIEFTVPVDFSSPDSSFLFSARLRKNGTTYTLAGTERIAVRGIPKALAPTPGQELSDVVNFRWNPVFGATQYHFELVRFIDGMDPKGGIVNAGEIALDTIVVTNTLTFAPTKTGNYNWIVRAKTNDVWGGWSAGATFKVLSTASVSQRDLTTSITLFPSPASDLIYIQSKEGFVKRVSIYDMSGKEVRGAIGITVLTSFSVRELPAGVYNAKLTLDDGEVILPFVKR